MIPQPVQTMRGPKAGTGVASPNASTFIRASWRHNSQVTESERTPFSRVLASVIGAGRGSGCGVYPGRDPPVNTLGTENVRSLQTRQAVLKIAQVKQRLTLPAVLKTADTPGKRCILKGLLARVASHRMSGAGRLTEKSVESSPKFGDSLSHEFKTFATWCSDCSVS
jgi:hypothetical protein